MTAGRRGAISDRLAGDRHSLSFPADYRVRTISLCGMLIETSVAFDSESMVPMALSLHRDRSIEFLGRVMLGQVAEGAGSNRYNIGIEFIDVADDAKETAGRVHCPAQRRKAQIDRAPLLRLDPGAARTLSSRYEPPPNNHQTGFLRGLARPGQRLLAHPPRREPPTRRIDALRAQVTAMQKEL